MPEVKVAWSPRQATLLTSLDHGLPNIPVPVFHFSAAGRASHVALFVIDMVQYSIGHTAYQRGIADAT